MNKANCASTPSKEKGKDIFYFFVLNTDMIKFKLEKSGASNYSALGFAFYLPSIGTSVIPHLEQLPG